MVLFLSVISRDVVRHRWYREHFRKIKTFCFPVRNALARVEQVRAADQVVELADAELRHQLTRLFGHEKEEIDDVLGLALELTTQDRVLRRHPHRTSIEMALAHHD